MKKAYLRATDIVEDLVKEYQYKAGTARPMVTRMPFPTQDVELFATITGPDGRGAAISLGTHTVFLTPADVEAHFNMRKRRR